LNIFLHDYYMHMWPTLELEILSLMNINNQPNGKKIIFPLVIFWFKISSLWNLIWFVSSSNSTKEGKHVFCCTIFLKLAKWFYAFFFYSFINNCNMAIDLKLVKDSKGFYTTSNTLFEFLLVEVSQNANFVGTHHSYNIINTMKIQTCPLQKKIIKHSFLKLKLWMNCPSGSTQRYF